VEATLRRTPLFDRHVALGARMVPFAGYEMPVQYEGVIAEHKAVRTDAGAFDVSHMGEIHVDGPSAQAFLQAMLSNDVDLLVDGGAQYTLLTNPSGGIVDDLIAYRLGTDRWLLVVNSDGGTQMKDYLLNNCLLKTLLTFAILTPMQPLFAAAPYTRVAEVFPSDPAANQFFGLAVAMNDDVAVVGAPINPASGAAYVYVRTDTGWVFPQKLEASDGPGQAGFTQFGWAVAVAGDTIAVAAPRRVSAGKFGAVYIFKRPATGTTWTEQAIITSRTPRAFGQSVALRGGTLGPRPGSHEQPVPPIGHRARWRQRVRRGQDGRTPHGRRGFQLMATDYFPEGEFATPAG